MRRRASRAGRAWAMAWVAFALAGCGEAADEGIPALQLGGPPGEGGTLTWVVADRVESFDPLVAETRAEQLVTRQINEPLTQQVASPFDPERRVPGLVRRARGSGDNVIWTLHLRSGVVFQDGEPFNGAAVRVNATRWQTTAAGRALLPDLLEVASPKPDVVQFVLAAPDPRFPKRLASPRLGIVSPAALEPASGSGAVLARPSQTGTGPFELFGRSASTRVLARNTSWWGLAADVDIGPALEQIEIRTEPSAELRLALLDAGDAQLADELGPEQARLAAADPLLSVLRGRGRTWLGLERSVRGVESAERIPSLASAWLTTLTTAG